jgi:hypothetical protein
MLGRLFDVKWATPFIVPPLYRIRTSSRGPPHEP